MNFWETQAFWDVIRDIVIAVVSAVLLILGYDRRVAKPRADAIRSMAFRIERDFKAKVR